ncbi:glycoside hydrolase family 88 protein [Streptomyces tricolor]|nr:glycoside hydrolase family 88 protein [Streptomyces tricolor]
MMNLDLLVFASRQTGDTTYLDIAVQHAKTAQRFFPRPDGSTPHVYDFDPDTGAPIGPNTVQGCSPASCWSRGQAWGIYGFTTMYRRTGDKEFRDTARKLADFAIGALTPDHVPVWDYRAPQQPYDIRTPPPAPSWPAACSTCTRRRAGTPTGRRPCACSPRSRRPALTTNSARADAVVARCTRNRPAEDGIEISLPYADYYLLRRHPAGAPARGRRPGHRSVTAAVRPGGVG